MEIKKRLSPFFLMAILFATSPVESAPDCDLNTQEGNSKPPCDSQSAEEIARQKEYAEFEASYPMLLAKKNIQRRAEDLNTIKNLTSDEFCIAYGEVSRGDKLRMLGAEGYVDGEVLSILKKQAKYRKLNIDDAMVINQRIYIGMTRCMLYASLGRPAFENRTVGRWGVHSQHVYRKYGFVKSDEYVYTENGRVTGWQD